MRRLLLAFALLLPAPLAAQPVATTLAPDAEARWVPFELTPGNHIRFTARINGAPAQALLDTGVSDSVVTPGFAARAGLRGTIRARADAVGGSVDLAWAAARDIQVGGLSRRGGRIGITPLAAGASEQVDALIGTDLFATGALEIDYDARRFRLLPSGRLPFRGTALPLGYDQVRRSYVSEVHLGRRRIAPALVDTGDAAELTLRRAAWAAAALPPQPVSSALLNGLGGPIEADVTSTDAVALGGLAIRDVELWIEGDGGLSARRGFAGRIGSGLLQRLHVLLDPGAGRMVVAPGSGSVLPPPRSTSGLVVLAEAGRFTVLYVMRNSPAAAGGWRSGERICAVDGVAVSPRAEAPRDDWTRGEPGRTLRLKLCDGQERVLTLRKFY